VSIGNPVLSLTKCLWTVSTRNGLEADAYRIAEDGFYSDLFGSREDMAHAIAIAGKLSPIYYIFTLRRIEELTQHASPLWASRIKASFSMFVESHGKRMDA
jgi:hypothetical protein